MRTVSCSLLYLQPSHSCPIETPSKTQRELEGFYGESQRFFKDNLEVFCKKPLNISMIPLKITLEKTLNLRTPLNSLHKRPNKMCEHFKVKVLETIFSTWN